MAAIDDLNTAVANLEAEQALITTAVTDLLAEVVDLQNAIATGNSALIEAAAVSINNVANALGVAAKADPGPQPAPTPVPVQAFDPGTNLALYTFTGTGSIDTSYRSWLLQTF